ncbi:pyridoxamine 5'-phosphate oxidase family protein [Bradyrhizobium sp. LHD-71]|uniref:pyridoxamine 5'-phosphate oxidase family protein n=1 Tax=Bradyrhizobium sp. LHD-71 TaxID=3072141 RepID=UPI0028107E31|nr:pyridoxamine 5'-phosphate oxidase family protein [Bradyrhizobium sp. LHD-71]MDQ8727379.1 pyridoxamine 5'-phosphate oxidase family protein [Bradyrhizobium sp. LHD-71]
MQRNYGFWIGLSRIVFSGRYLSGPQLPNHQRNGVSPKGNFVVLDKKSMAIGELRSPGTLRNIRANPVVESNYLDVPSRRAVRLSGTARYVEWNTAFESHPTAWRVAPLKAAALPWCPGGSRISSY